MAGPKTTLSWGHSLKNSERLLPQILSELVLYFCSLIASKDALSPGPVFTKGLRLRQVIGLNPVLKLRLLSQLIFS